MKESDITKDETKENTEIYYGLEYILTVIFTRNSTDINQRFYAVFISSIYYFITRREINSLHI